MMREETTSEKTESGRPPCEQADEGRSPTALRRRMSRVSRQRTTTAQQGVLGARHESCPQPVPIAEVGTAVRDAADQVGIILDVEDRAGTLTYLVQFAPRIAGAHCQYIAARALKGVEL